MNLVTVKTLAAAAATAMALTATSETTIPANAYIQDGLVVQFDAIENAGSHTHDAAATVWKDLSGNGRDATLNSYYAGCWTANSLVMNNSLYASFVTNFPGAFTVEIICSAPFGSAKSTYNTLFCAKDDNYSIFKNSAALTFKQAVASSRPSIAGYNGSSVVAQIDGETVSIGYQGEQFYSTTGTAISSTGNRTWCIGGADGSHALTGEIFAVRVYGRVLTADEIAYNKTIDRIRYEDADPTELLPSVSPEMFPDGVRWSSGGNCLEYSLSLVGEEGATMSFDNVTFASSVNGWFALGSSLTVYARPASGQSIAAWRGAPADAQISADMTSATFAMLGPVSISTLSHAPTTFRWRGGSSTLASDMANWAKDDGSVATSLPLDGDAIVLDASSGDMTWDLVNVRPGSWTQEDGYAGTVTFDTGLKTVEVTGNVNLQSGTWTHAENPSCTKDTDAWRSTRGTKQLIVSCGGKFDFGENAMIDVTGRGYRTHEGPGSNVENGNHGGAGGSYGGAGVTQNGWTSGRNIGVCYGSAKTPDSLGSGGNGSAGGGAVQIAVAGKLTLDGTITADGEYASGWYAGSGGSIYLTAGSVAGAGTLRAAGGAAKNEACGGGGRIALYVTDEGSDYEDFTGIFDVSTVANGMAPFGGTVYREKKADNGRGELWVKGYNAPTAKIPEPMTLSYETKGLYGTFLGPKSGTMSVGTLRMSGHARLHVPSNVTLSVQRFVSENDGAYTNLVVLLGGKLSLAKDAVVTDLEVAPFWEPSDIVFDDDVTDKTLRIANGGRISPAIDMTLHGDLRILSGGAFSHYLGYPIALTVPGDCTIDAGGAIDVSGRGYVKDTGPGKSTIGKTGGSHGGRGNGGAPTGDSGPGSNGSCYGSVTAPVSMGSGGRFGTGGGAIKLTVADTLTVNGAINANGGYSDHYSGAGGSAWILTKRLLGLGPISANGGLVSPGGECNGTGGGGRVAVWMTDHDYDFSEYTGVITAYGGSKPDGKIYGGAGTVYRKLATEAQNEGTLVIDNGLTSQYKNYECRVDPLVTDADVGTVIVTNNATFAVTNGAAFTFRKQWIVSSNARFRGYPGSTVVCAPCGTTATMSGTNYFSNFTCEAPGKTLKFGAADSKFEFREGGVLTLKGAEDQLLTLVSVLPGAYWTVNTDPSVLQEMEFLDVSDSDAWNGAMMVAKQSRGKDQNNRNWNFVNIEEGATNTWTGTASSSWTDAGNWELGRAPAETDNIVVPAVNRGPELAAGVSVWSVTVKSGATLTLAGNDLTTRDLTVGGTLVAGGAETVTVTRNVDFSGGTFATARSVLRLTGDGDQTVTSGGVVFRDVTAEKSGGVLTFADALTADRFRITATDLVTARFSAVSGVSAREVAFDGLVGGAAKLTLEGDVVGHVWPLTAEDYAFAAGVTVNGSDASGGLRFCTSSPSSGTGCQNWEFAASAYVWTGAADTSFANPENWAGGVVPGAGAVVKLSGEATIVVDAPLALGSLELGGGDAAVSLTANAPLTVGSSLVVATNGTFVGNTNVTVGGAMIVRNGGLVTHDANGAEPENQLTLEVSGNVTVEEKGSVSACGKGYPASWKGPGSFGYGREAGASHGGRGCGMSGGSVTKDCYGSAFRPETFGTSGNKAGGGVIRLAVDGTLTVDGSIDANGEDHQTDWYSGAGGSVWLTAARLLGRGVISANGGDEKQSRPGGGGRVAIYLTQDTELGFGGRVEAKGGRQGYYELASDKTPLGAAGTVYVQCAGVADGAGTLTVDNGRSSFVSYSDIRTATDMPAAGGESGRDFRNATLIVSGGSALRLTADVTVYEFEFASGCKIYLDGHTLTIRSHQHLDRSNPKGHDYKGTIDAGAGGRIVWRPVPLAIIVR